MKEGAPESGVNLSRLKKQKQSILIKQIDVIIANNRVQTYKQIKTGELVYIISEKQLKEIQASLKYRGQLQGTNIQSINARLVDDLNISGYTYYDYHLRPQTSEQNQDQQLKIRVLNKNIHSRLMKMATNIRWIVLERKLIKIKGQKQLQMNPFRIQIELISMKSIKQAKQRSKTQNRHLAECLIFQKIKLNFYSNQTIEQLLVRIRNVLPDKNKQFRIYTYDSTLFSQFSFFRTLEYFYNKQNTRYPINQQQSNFYKLQERDILMSSHILQFFPGKLLSNQSVSQIKQMRIEKLVLQINDEDWVFPNQPDFSVAKHCRFCMFKMQLYKHYQCKQCGHTYLFCSKVCHYQFLIDHSCSQAKDQIRQIYGEQYLKKQKAVYLSDNLKTSDVVIQKKDVIAMINSNSSRFDDFNKNNSLNWKSSFNSLGGGMNNLGNTCYLNASLQTLIRTSLTNILLEMQREIKTNRRCKLSKAYLQLIKKMHKLAPNQSLDFRTMQSFKIELQLSLVQFQGYAQHDAHQFIMFFMDKLSEQLNTNTKNIFSKNDHNSQRGQDQILAKKEWLQLIQKNNSPIINLFYGQIKSQIDCPHCHTTNKTFDSFSILSLSIPQKNQTVTIQLFYETYMFKQKIKYLKLENPGNNIQQIIKNVMVRLGYPAERSQLVDAFLIGFQGKCPKLDKNKAVSELVPQLYSIKQLQNQLFLFELPNKQASMLLIKFLYQQKTFTFKKPLYFTDPKSKIRNYKIYNMITQYLTNLASHYLNQNYRSRKSEELKKKMQIKPQSYFNIRLVYPRDGKQDQIVKLYILPNTQIKKELQKTIQVEVCIQRFDQLSNLDKEFFDIIMKKLNKYVKVTDNALSKIKNNLDQPPQVLEDCLREQFNRKQLLANGNEWFCSTCNEKRRVYKIAHLYKTNKYLFIQIKRFKQGVDGKFYKNYSKVSPPLELDLHRILENPTMPEAYYKDMGEDQLKRYNLPKEINQKECYMYNLIGIILHEGKLGSGHYTAFYKSREWLEYNDLKVSKIDIQKILKQSKTMEKVYILLYERAQ